jgi:hypothetical protein
VKRAKEATELHQRENNPLSQASASGGDAQSRWVGGCCGLQRWCAVPPTASMYVGCAAVPITRALDAS